MTISALLSATSSSAISVWRIQDCAATVVSRLIGSGQKRATSRTISTTLSLFLSRAASSKQSVVFPTPCVPMKATFIGGKRKTEIGNRYLNSFWVSILSLRSTRFPIPDFRFTSPRQAELAAQLLAVGVERGGERHRRHVAGHVNRGCYEGHPAGVDDGPERAGRLRPEGFERAGDGARRNA